MTPELVALVKKEEGWVDHPYLCPAGWPTIGWGHVLPNLDHPKITVAEGEALLFADLREKQDQALRLSPGLATEPRRLAAITDFCFNLGSFAYSNSQLRKAVDTKRWPDAGEQMRRWVWAHDKRTGKMFKMAGLIDRRNITATWLETGG